MTRWQRLRLLARSASVYLKAAAGLVGVLAVLRASAARYTIVALTIALVLAVGLVNSALETLIDRLHLDAHPEIRIVKDMAAASVLLVSLGTLALGVLLVFAAA